MVSSSTFGERMLSGKEVMPMTTYETLMVALTTLGIIIVVLIEYIKK